MYNYHEKETLGILTPTPTNTTTDLISFSIAKTFLSFQKTRCNLQNRNSCDYLVYLSMWKGHGTLYCLLAAQLLLLIHDLICSVADGRKQASWAVLSARSISRDRGSLI